MSFWFWAFIIVLLILMGLITVDFDGIIEAVFDLIERVISLF